MTTLPGPEVLHVPSPDGTRIAVFAVPAPGDGGGRRGGGLVGHGLAGRPAPVAAMPVLLVHGTGSDHTTWRVAGPLLAARRPVHAMDRRGRGGSSDGPAHEAAREVEDVAEVAGTLAARHGSPVAVVGHSLGGRLALAAARRTPAIDRVVAYESAPGLAAHPEAGDPETGAHEALLARLRADLARGDPAAVLAGFLAEAAGLPPDELDAFRASPLWPVRVATAGTIVRELHAALHDPAIGRAALAEVTVPVLQLVGSASPRWFRAGAEALDRRLPAGRLLVIEGAGHGAHHTHAAELVAAIEGFLPR